MLVETVRHCGGNPAIAATGAVADLLHIFVVAGLFAGHLLIGIIKETEAGQLSSDRHYCRTCSARRQWRTQWCWLGRVDTSSQRSTA